MKLVGQCEVRLPALQSDQPRYKNSTIR